MQLPVPIRHYRFKTNGPVKFNTQNSNWVGSTIDAFVLCSRTYFQRPIKPHRSAAAAKNDASPQISQQHLSYCDAKENPQDRGKARVSQQHIFGLGFVRIYGIQKRVIGSQQYQYIIRMIQGGLNKKVESAEDVFKVVIVLVGIILSFCVKSILRFRDYCQESGYYIFQAESLVYCAIGFFGVWFLKYGFYYLFLQRIENMLMPKYEGDARTLKAKGVAKLVFDTWFYFSTTLSAFLIFRKEPWFTSMIGGEGKCSNMYTHYPDWPVEKRNELEIFFMLQLGVHIFSVVELVVARRHTDRKFYQNLLHHFVAASLILCSMACNEITAGVVIVIVHDCSDILLAFCRSYIETTLPKIAIITVPFATMMVVCWIYMRLIVFPLCLLRNVYLNRPAADSPWAMVDFAYMYQLVMASVLFGMHVYWTFYLIKSVTRSAKERDTINIHDKFVKGK